MPLQDIPFPATATTLPSKVKPFLADANNRVEQFVQTHQITSFIPSNYEQVFHALEYLHNSMIAPGNNFCEWGSGLGVIACLAAMNGFHSCGIEINAELVAEAVQLAEDYSLSVEFHCDSFIPNGSDSCLDRVEVSSWLTTHEGDLQEEHGVSPENYDVIFAYPWPGEEQIIEALFELHASVGAILVTFDFRDGIRLQRKVRRMSASYRHRKRSLRG